MRVPRPKDEFFRRAVEIPVEGYAPWLVVGVNCDSHEAQMPGMYGVIYMLSQIGPGYVSHVKPFSPRKALFGCWTRATAACANLDEVKIPTTAGDQVDFSIGTPPIAGDQRQAITYQGLRCNLLAISTKADFGARHAVSNDNLGISFTQAQSRRQTFSVEMGDVRKEPLPCPYGVGEQGHCDRHGVSD